MLTQSELWRSIEKSSQHFEPEENSKIRFSKNFKCPNFRKMSNFNFSKIINEHPHDVSMAPVPACGLKNVSGTILRWLFDAHHAGVAPRTRSLTRCGCRCVCGGGAILDFHNSARFVFCVDLFALCTSCSGLARVASALSVDHVAGNRSGDVCEATGAMETSWGVLIGDFGNKNLTFFEILKS